MADIIREYPNSFNLPRRIEGLSRLAHNLWWVWNLEAQRVFQYIDGQLWDSVNHNPIAFMHNVERTRINLALNEPTYLEQYDRVISKFDHYLADQNTWCRREHPELLQKQIAYLSFEFGIHESLPVYAGGLGILSGDHLKESSDLGLPLTAVGFIYNQGYFVQHLSEDGWQETRNAMLDFNEMPVVELLDKDRKPLKVSVDLPGRKVFARIWLIEVGRISLYLLDSNVEENAPADRQLTARLYSNDPEIRISQEILLGMGGVQALRLVGINPEIWHMNEGHSAFLTIERLREFVKAGVPLKDAMDRVRQSNIFTTHTPVPAGNDQFPLWLMDKYFSQIYAELGLTRDQFIDLGRQAQPWGESFVMPVLALHLSERANAVSELHGRVSRKMWNFLWPDKAEKDVPIGYVTNGVHTRTWLARRMGLLFDTYLPEGWAEHIDDLAYWEPVRNIPDEELWAVMRHLKNKLVGFANEKTRQAWLNGTITATQAVAGGVFLDPYALTIGFARRFATYKRANLIFHDLDRIIRLLTNAHMPVQIIFSGKAHPADEPGKLIIQEVYRAVKDSRSGGRLVFLEDYDMNIARYLVQGVDVWLNTPRRPNEASGTSGMKAALNGVLQFSTLDGWWREGYNGRNGWAIGQDKEFDDPARQDAVDSASLYETLEDQIVPLYYHNRTSDSLPVEWIAMMKESIRTLAPQFSTHRMVKEYMQQMYEPAMRSVKK